MSTSAKETDGSNKIKNIINNFFIIKFKGAESPLFLIMGV
jgi:hypothetical protein